MNLRRLAATAAIFTVLAGSALPAAAAGYWAPTQYAFRQSVWQKHHTTQPSATFSTAAPKPAAPTTTTPSSSGTDSAALTALEQQMVDLVNQERTSRGLQALTVDTRLVKIARMKSQDMVDNNYFSHTSPVYGSPFDMMNAAGITFRAAGENLAGDSSVAAAHTALMNSAGHRANILNSSYTRIGIGIVKGGPYGYMFTQEFIG